MKKKSKRGGARKGAGRKPEGKSKYSVTLTAKSVTAAKARVKNFSRLMDELLTAWLAV